MTKEIIDEIIEFIRKRPAGRGLAAHALWFAIWSAILRGCTSFFVVLVTAVPLIAILKKMGQASGN